jgi:hypothetical protein
MGNSGDITPVMLLDVNQVSEWGAQTTLQNAPVLKKINHNFPNFTATSAYWCAQRAS